MPFSRAWPRSSGTSFRFSSAGGRARSKLSSTITSVPPWIGTASGRSAFSASASSRLGGVRTSTVANLLRRSKVGHMPDLARRLAVARGDEPAELVVRGGRVFSVFTREWLETDVAGGGGFVAGLGGYEGEGTPHAGGRYAVPGFPAAPIHPQSAKLLGDGF